MAIFIAVRAHETGSNPWLAMIAKQSEESLRSETQYSSSETRNFPRSPNDTPIGTQKYLDTDTQVTNTLHLFKLPGAVTKRAGFKRK